MWIARLGVVLVWPALVFDRGGGVQRPRLLYVNNRCMCSYNCLFVFNCFILIYVHKIYT